MRRLLLTTEPSLSEQDYSEILSLAKAHLTLAPAPIGHASILPVAGQFSGAPATKVSVKLLSIDNVQDVNVIKPGQQQSFAENGVTVLYGDNGTGKSGYSRILKLSCHARDKKERILPNVFAKTPTGKPTATLKIKQDGALRDIVWTQDAPADTVLTNITVFDGRCARVITDERNQSSYLPYGGDVFSKLSDVVLRVKADLEKEVLKIEPVQDSAVIPGTISEKFLETLSENTKDDVVQTFTKWTTEDDAQLITSEELARTSNATKAAEEIARLEKIKGRLNGVLGEVVALNQVHGNLTNEVIHKVLSEINAAQGAYATAMAEKKTPEPLEGVTGSQWEILYKVAKKYSEEVAYPGELFPKTADALCVLCQQPLSDEAVDRFNRFRKYIEDVTGAVLAAKRSDLKSLREKAEGLMPLTGAFLESICDELSGFHATVADDLRAYYTAVSARKTAILTLLKEGESSDKAQQLSQWPEPVDVVLKTVISGISKKITDVANAAKPDEYKKLMANLAELKSRKALNARITGIEQLVAKSRRNAALRGAMGALRTHEITKEGTALIKKNLTPELKSTFKAELTILEAARLPISWKASGEEGETAHEMLLEGANAAGGVRTSHVLSEGEARVIAVAGFLAELHLGQHSNPIILDDPASSLDHVFAGKIASRLIKEGLSRQVIIFTHNIGFLMDLQDAAEDLALAGTPVGLDIHALRRAGEWSGVTTKELPWHAKAVKSRISHMEDELRSIKPLYPDNMTKYNDGAAHIYGLLRETWEACVENDLFDRVVCRYRNSVQTRQLNVVSIEDQDVRTVERYMTKTSTWMTGHDKSKALHENRPSPDELAADITALRDFSKQISDRKKVTKYRREECLQPKVAVVVPVPVGEG